MTGTSSVESIFFDALGKRSPEERTAFLSNACGTDSDLRRRVDRLLAAQSMAGSFLEQPALAGNATILTDSSISEAVGAVIGPYKLLQQIGEGGMGVVFMAEQSEPIQRTVALKIIKPGMDSRQVIARFEAERQALAMMDHPNIAKVLDAGTTDTGRPYFVMELVKGVPVTKYCDEHQFTLRQRLELFLPVCQAVQHAHQKGIIHRDIKPTNVLVAEYDNQAVPKIIDFGVSKATAQKLTERTMFTEFGQIIGTVEYMSPEQAKFNQLDIDTRSDIYSLGVLLYELLAGSTPFEKSRLREAALDEVLRMIREEEPPKPSTRLSSSDALPSIAANRHCEPAKLSREVQGELDWIVMRALEKDRQRRYQTASAFAEDLERYLGNDVVTACPPSRTYRMKKFIRRHRTSIVAGSSIAAALVAGMTLAAIGLWRATQQAEIARKESIEAKNMSERATRVQTFLSEMLTSANPESQPGAAVTVQQMIDRAADQIDSSFSDEPGIRAVLHQTIGETYYGLRLYPLANSHLRKAVELRRRFVNDERLQLAEALSSLAKSESTVSGDHQLALSSAREAIMHFKSTVPANDWRIAVARATERYMSGPAAGGTTSNLWTDSAIQLFLGIPDEYVTRLSPDFVQAITEAKRQKTAGDNAGAEATMRRLAVASAETTRKLVAAGDRQGVRKFIHGHYAPLIEVPSVRQLIPISAVGRARILRNEKEHPMVVEAMLLEAIDLGHAVWGADHPHIAAGLYELAALRREEGQLGDAEAKARDSFEMQKKVLGNENPETAKARELLIDILEEGGKSAEADGLRPQ